MVEGSRAVMSALQSGTELEAIYFEPSSNDMTNRVFDLATKIGYRLYEVAPGVLARASDAVTPQAVMAIASFVDRDIADVELSSLVVVMVGVRDPGNAGTVVRSGLAAGASAVILCDQCVDIYNPKTVRSSAGAFFSTPIAIVDTFDQACQQLRSQGYRIIGTSSHVSLPYWHENLSGKVALVLGNEGSGLSEDYWHLLDTNVTVPIDARAESLNVGVAAAVLMFEGMRQRMAETSL